MSYAAVNKRYRANQWARDPREVRLFAGAMVEADYLRDAQSVLDYFDYPTDWSPQHAWWDATGRSTDQVVWEAAEDRGWQL